MRIMATGMMCPVGLTSRMACAALRAGIVAFRELPYWDSEKMPVVGAAVPGVGDVQFGPRLAKLLAGALRDCLSHLPNTRWEAVPLLVGLSEPDRPGAGVGIASSIISMVQDELGVTFHPRLSGVLATGHTAGFEGLYRARQLLNDGAVAGAVVCGVDSYINASTLYWLDQNLRLKRENHADGIVPGEAAAAIYVERPRFGGEAADIVGIGIGYEKASLLSGEPLLANGLASAARTALAEAGWGLHELDLRISDVTGETYGFREHTLAIARLVERVRHAPLPIWHPAESIGDTGAAAGLVQLAWASAANSRRYAPGSRVLCFTSALAGRRAAVAVSCSRGLT